MVDLDKILIEANNRFPIGTIVICNLGSFSTTFMRKYKLEKYNNAIAAMGEPWVYFAGNWSEIVELPKKVNQELIIEI